MSLGLQKKNQAFLPSILPSSLEAWFLDSAMGELKGKVYANAAAAQSPFEQDLRGSATEPKVGELLPGEAESGGLGRHLGLWSTVALMYTLPLLTFLSSLFC